MKRPKTLGKPILEQFRKFCISVSFGAQEYTPLYSNNNKIRGKIINLDNNLFKKRLVDFGPEIVPHFADYVLLLQENNYKELIVANTKPNISDLEQSCISLFCGIVEKHKINIDKVSPINNISEWLNWGKDFDPDNSYNYIQG